MKWHDRPVQPVAAFTLIEVVISSALMALILVSAYLCFSASIATRKTMEPRLEVIQNARVAMALMAADLRAACPLDRDFDFLGMHRMMGDTVADNLDFATHNYTPQHLREGDFCEVSYYLDRDPQSGQFSLWRRRNPTIAPDSLSGGSKEEIATGLLGLQFEYSDGLDWYDSWGELKPEKTQTSERALAQANLSGMPEAVRITLWFDSDPHKKSATEPDETQPAASLAFQTVARLNLAGAAANTASSSSGSGGTSGATGPSQSTVNTGGVN
ncbi:MAG: PulJ/GspJ family protein [Verrucomicrobiota bacterium]